MPKLRKITQRVSNYLRVEFTNSNPEVENIALNKHMMSVYAEAMIYGIQRIMIVINAKPHIDYSIADLERHAIMADSIFGGMKIAYVNQNIRYQEREKFIATYTILLKDLTLGVFHDEAEAAAWLMIDA